MSKSFARTYESERVGPRWLRQTLLPLFLMCVCPPASLIIWYTHTHLEGSVINLFKFFVDKGINGAVVNIWKPYVLGSKNGWILISCFAVFELMLMRILPGKKFEGPVTANGNIPKYKANGVMAYFITMGTFSVCSFGLKLFDASVFYDNMGGIIGALNGFSLLFCVVLYLKGIFHPSSSDHSAAGNPVFDYYWGTELYPRIFGWDVKQFTNCRFGMMIWPVLLVSYAAKQAEEVGLSDSMFVAVALQLVYITKFFVWENGYLRSLDIMHDRAGFYICWGCLVWVPSVYTSATLYLVNHPRHLGTPLAAFIFIFGVASIMTNYAADEQRQRVREKKGETTIWGKKPELINAHYMTEKKEQKQSLLLVSGFWGLSRHFHYIPEILSAISWCIPALFDNVLPYFYVVFLMLLLNDRSMRDDNRCAIKYGEDWKKYCSIVKYRIIPFIL